MNWLKKINNPLLFQGRGKKDHYFEGWYYRQVTEDLKNAISLIPGVSLFDGDMHSFVQYIHVKQEQNGTNSVNSGYIRYPFQEFVFHDDSFELGIADNVFSKTTLSVRLSDHKLDLDGSIGFGPFTEIKKSVWMPNIMGYYAYFPGMECYHGIGSMMHSLTGCLNINGTKIDFTNGKGYIEKDWGTSFPQKYVWIQCNHFENEDIGLFCSIADIPFMGASFMGFIANLVMEGREYRYATYNRSSIELLQVDENGISINLQNSESILNIIARIPESGYLVAPKLGKMEKNIKEGLSGEVWIEFYNKQKKVSKHGHGCMAGIEIVGF